MSDAGDGLAEVKRRFAEISETWSGADPGFQVRGGELKKNAQSGRRHEKFWGISCEKNHTENSGFAHATLPWHISTFRGYQILFSIRNPYINHFTNYFSIHS